MRMIERNPSDRHDDTVAAQTGALVIAGIVAILAIGLVLVVLYANGYPI